MSDQDTQAQDSASTVISQQDLPILAPPSAEEVQKLLQDIKPDFIELSGSAPQSTSHLALKNALAGKPAPAVSPEESRRILAERTIDGPNVFVPKKARRSKAKNLAGQPGKADTEGGIDSVPELARALRNDVDLIYYHVRNNIEYYPTYGVQKGIGALIDGIGNPFDQASVLVAALREAGYTANFVFGDIDLSNEEIAAWLGTDSSDIQLASGVLSNGGIPNTTYQVGSDWRITLSHIWVKVTIGGTDYVLDPSYKAYTNIAGIDLAEAMDYDQASLLAAASNGATFGADDLWVKDVNETAVRDEMAGYANNLVDWIKTNNPTATVEDILGGRKINEVSSPVRQTSLPYETGSPSVWTDIPNSYRTTMRLQYPSGFDQTLYSDDIYGKRLTIFFNTSVQPVLRLDGTTVATGPAQSFNTARLLSVTVTHPYAVTTFNQTTTVRIDAPILFGGQQFPYYYCIGSVFGDMRRGMLVRTNRLLAAESASGAAQYSENLLGSQLVQRWNTFVAQQGLIADLTDRMTSCVSVNHHIIGRTFVSSFPEATGIDVSVNQPQVSSLIPNNADNYSKNWIIKGTHGFGGEGLSGGQSSSGVGSGGSGPHRALQVANAAGKKIYRATKNNFFSDVVPNLSGYTIDMNTLYANHLFFDQVVFLSEEGHQTAWTWQNNPVKVDSYIACPPTGGPGGYIFNFKGFFDDLWMDAWKFEGAQPKRRGRSSPCSPGDGPANDTGRKPGGGLPPGNFPPGEGVFPGSGSWNYSHQAFTTGSSFPYGLSFQLEYNSSRRLDDKSPVGLGWTHNWIQNAQLFSDPFIGAGADSGSAITASSTIAELFVSADLGDRNYSTIGVMTSAFATSWWVQQNVRNCVRIELADEIRIYYRLADGSFYRKADSSVITESNGKLVLTTPQQTVRTFDADGNLESIEYPFGVTVSLSYSSGKLVSVTNGMGRSLSFSYSGDLLTSVDDGNGREVNLSHDSSKQLTAIEDPLEESTTFSYSSEPGQLVSYFEPENPSDPLVINSYDDNGWIISQLDANGNETKFYKTGQRHEFVNALGHSIVYFLNSNDQITKEIDELGFQTNYSYDQLGRLVEVEYPDGQKLLLTYTAKHNVATSTSKAKPASGLSDIVRSATYESTFNKVATATDGRGNTTTYSYTNNGQIETIVKPAVSGGSPTVTMTYNERGQPVTIMEPTGIVTKLEYAFDSDPQANEVVTKITFDFGTGRKNLVTEYGYNAWGDITNVIDPRGNESTATFDYKRRSTESQRATPFNFVSKFTFDKNDNLVKIERQTGNPLAPWQTSEATHDIDGKLLTMKDPLNIVTTRQYDQLNRLWKFTDGENRTTERLYDERSQVETVIEPGNHVVETNTYGPSGELLSVEDEKNFVVQFIVDGFNRLSKVIYPDSTFEQIVEYDANGNALSTLTRASDTIAFTFDALNRVLTKAADGKPVVSFSYDLSGRIESVSTPVQSGNPDSGVFQYFYDSAGRGVGEELPDGKAIAYELDPNGNVVRVTYPDSYFVERVFDQLNRLTDIKLNGSTSAAAHFDYNDLSKRTQLSFNNGSQVNYEYESNDRLSKIEQQFDGSSARFEYSYNQAHEAVISSASSKQFVWTPSLDKSTNYGAVNNLNQYPTVDGESFSYNDNGCLTSDGEWTFSYDSENQLLSAAHGSDLAQFAHDPMNRQTQKDVNSAKTRFVYSGWQRLADYDGTSDSLQKRYVYGVGLDEPLFEVSPAGVITNYFHRDRLGSVIATSDTDGAVTNQYSYSPFGESNDMAGTTFGYTGQRFDAEIGLYFYKRRYYSPKIGRFLQPDPITNLGNLYSYCSNDPINFTDPLGEATLGDVVQAFVNFMERAFFKECAKKLDELKKKRCTLTELCHMLEDGHPYGENIWKLELEFAQAEYGGRLFGGVAQSLGGIGRNFGRMFGMRYGNLGGRGSTYSMATNGGTGIPARATYNVTEAGITRIESHLNAIEVDSYALKDPGNAAMISRLRSGSNSPYDMNFYLHELKESAVYARNGQNYTNAHQETLQWQAIPDTAEGTAQIYHPEVILQNAENFSIGAINEARRLLK